MTRIRPSILLPALTALVLLTATARADDDDHERARSAFQAGEIVPLSAILAQVEPKTDGEILEIELEDDDGHAFVYEVRLLTPDGRIVERRFDARSGKPLGKTEGGD